MPKFAAGAAHDKGSAFEALAEYLFGTLTGIEVVNRDIKLASKEIDLVLWNARVEEVLQGWDDVILVECKVGDQKTAS